MNDPTVLVVEDEADIQELLTFNLSRAGYQVDAVRSGEEALARLRDVLPDLVLLDLMLPGINGLEVCRTMKRTGRTGSVPIVMLTAKGEESDIVAGLEFGADDYVTKPFSPKVLLARIRAVLRRGATDDPDAAAVLRVHDLVIDPNRHAVTVAEQAVSLTAQEFGLLQLLARRPGWVYTRNQIVEAVRGSDYPVTERAIDVQMVGLRKKLAHAGLYIETVRGVGYRFKE